MYDSFNTIEKTCNFVRKIKCQIIGQGLTKSYEIVHFGTGYNKYTIFLRSVETAELFEFCTEDNYITEWRSRTRHERDENESADFAFQAYGNFHGLGFYWLYGTDFQDNTAVDVCGKKFQIIKIVLEVADLTEDRSSLCDGDAILKRRYAIIDLHQTNSFDDAHLREIPFNEFTRNLHSTYYFVSENNTTIYQVTPMSELVVIDNGCIIEVSGKMCVEYGDVKRMFHVVTEWVDLTDEKYNVNIEFTKNIEILGDKEEIDDYCYVAVLDRE